MKSSIALLAIPALAAVVLAGCSQTAPRNSTDMSSPSSSMGNASGMMSGTTNMKATHDMSNMNMSDMSATRNMSNMNMSATHSMSNMVMSTHATQ
ncbi:MAG TPA: hypothetical protein VNZ64_24560 [Candidatus Acidoferrum sp.]|jgi:hypothetical protein|nr:hypothetical protein [Candidatus Acidoferrum sp.]